MSKLAWITAVVLLMPAPAVAQIVFGDGPPAAPAKDAKAKSGVDKVICRSQGEIGSRLKTHQVCLTVDQWRTYELDNQHQLSDLQAKSPGPVSH